MKEGNYKPYPNSFDDSYLMISISEVMVKFLLFFNSKRYCFAGDDSVSAAVSDIVRGCLCPAIKAIFDHGLLRKSPLLSGPVHPWVFIEEAASKEVRELFLRE